MVRTYKKKTKRGEWSAGTMKEAVSQVLSRKMGYKKAANQFGVPQTTLERYVKKVKQGGEVSFGLPLGPIKTVFSEQEEREMVSYLKYMEERLFGLTTTDLRKMAYQLALRNGKKHNFSAEKQMAGLDWLKGFLRRHPDLSIRKPEATSAARAMGFNKVAVGNFYQLLGEIYDKYKLTPDKIYNCDETGISIVSKTKSKIIATKGRKQVGSLSSAERGSTTTVEICFNAAGTYMPPFMIFPRQRMKAELLDHAPPGTMAECNARGWMTIETFNKWFLKFISFTGASINNRVLLLLDGHVSHTKNIDVIDKARENGVIILCFPPHCTHRLQPADVAFMRPLSAYYDSAATAWLRSHPGRVITPFQISEIFGQAYIQTATMTIAINAFKKCGIWPYNANNFTDADFIAAETTNIPIIDESESVDKNAETARVVENSANAESFTGPQSLSALIETDFLSVPVAAVPRATPVTVEPQTAPVAPAPVAVVPQSNPVSVLLQSSPVAAAPVTVMAQYTPVAGPSSASENYVTPTCDIAVHESERQCSSRRSPIQAVCRDLTSIFANASPADIIPIPSVGHQAKRKQYRRGKTAIITSTPYKNELENWKKSKICDSANDPNLGKNYKKGKGKGKKTAKTQKETEDTICLYCNDINNTYLKSSEGWVGCQLCGHWAHTACAGVDEDNLEEPHICVHCENQ